MTEGGKKKQTIKQIRIDLYLRVSRTPDTHNISYNTNCRGQMF